LERLIFLAIFPRCPNKQVAEDDERNHGDNGYLSGELHLVSVLQGSASVALPTTHFQEAVVDPNR
jgi:hypothetical protein